MILKNIHISIFVSLLFCLTHIKAKPETIKIINKTDSALNVNFTVPEQTVASIKLKKLDALHDAIVADSSEKIRKAVLDGADVNHLKDGKTPLLWAIILQCYNALDTLLHLGAKPNDACITQATNMKDLKSLLLLLRQGATNLDFPKVLDLIDQSLIHHKFDDSIAMIRELVNRGYNVNDLWTSAIILARYKATEGEEVIRFLLSRGANPNYNSILNNPHKLTKTPLVTAAIDWPNKQILEILIEAGADLNQYIKHNSNLPPCSLLSCVQNRLHADDKKRIEVIVFLLKQGAPL